MAIHYSLTARVNRLIKSGAKLAYARAQSAGTVSLRAFSNHIAEHGSVFDRSVVEGVLTKAVQCMREQLLQGRIVELGDLGRFRIGLSSEGVEDVTNFTANNIKGVHVVWLPGAEFRNLKQDATFTYVTSLKKQAQDKKAEKEKLNTSLGVVPGVPENTGGSGGAGVVGEGADGE